jgi:hypothetical protein
MFGFEWYYTEPNNIHLEGSPSDSRKKNKKKDKKSLVVNKKCLSLYRTINKNKWNRH